MVENCCCLCLISDDIETWQIMFYPLAYRFGFCNTELVLGFCTEMSESLHNNNNNNRTSAIGPPVGSYEIASTVVIHYYSAPKLIGILPSHRG